MPIFGGGNQSGTVGTHIRDAVGRFHRLSIAVSYVQFSGWELLKPIIGGKARQVRLLCTDQFGVTDPAAVRAMQAAGVVVHVYTGAGVYHPKIYVAEFEGAPPRWILGSANLSRSALETGVEAIYSSEDSDEQALGWFNNIFSQRSSAFDEQRLAALEAAYAARIIGNLTTIRAQPVPRSNAPEDPTAADVIASAFGALPDIVVPLNADKAGNNVRTLRRIDQVLNDSAQLKGKALSEFKLLGLASGGGYSAVARAAKGRSIEEIAKLWLGWLKHASPAEITAANPSGRLARAVIAFDTFWSFPKQVRDYFLAHCESPAADVRPELQVIELLANTGRRLASLTLDDVSTLANLLSARSELSPRVREVVRDYLENKGTRGWNEPDRKIVLEAWRSA